MRLASSKDSVLTSFNDLGLAAPLLQALATGPYQTPTPIQAQAIPHVMQGRDLLGIAQTGTGKTAAFALPILHRLMQPGPDGRRPKAQPKSCRVLVLSPTRELASQIAERFRFYGHKMGVSVAIVFGGVSAGPQIKQLGQGVDVLVATPGRLLDHTGSRNLRLDLTEIVVLDEADQMFDMGFIQPIRKIVGQLPAKRQSLFFSATMPDDIAKLAHNFLSDPVRVAVTPVAATADRVEQRVIHIEGPAKRAILSELLKDDSIYRTLIFTRTKRGADRVAKHLEVSGVEAAAIHGNKSQGQRERALAGFREGKVRALVATDIAARGIDIPEVTHVINYELPNIPESYVHRIGRTARAGRAGIAISLCDHEERAYLRDIERLIRQKIPAEDRTGTIKVAAEAEAPRGPRPQHGRGGQHSGRPQSQGRSQGQARPQGQRHDGQRHEGQRADGQRAHQGQGQGQRPKQAVGQGQRTGQGRNQGGQRSGGSQHSGQRSGQRA
jgi:ATP-dependent RNA helicase RhlE